MPNDTLEPQKVGAGNLRNMNAQVSATCVAARQRLAEAKPILETVHAIAQQLLGIVTDVRKSGFTVRGPLGAPWYWCSGDKR